MFGAENHYKSNPYLGIKHRKGQIPLLKKNVFPFNKIYFFSFLITTFSGKESRLNVENGNGHGSVRDGWISSSEI